MAETIEGAATPAVVDDVVESTTTKSNHEPEQLNLVQLSQETEAKLHEVWREVGLSEEECSLQLHDLAEVVANVYQTRLLDEIALRDEMKNSVGELKGTISELATGLDEEFSSIPESHANTLMLQLTWLRDTYEKLNNIKSERLGRIQPLLDGMHKIWAEFDHPVETNFLDVGPLITEERLTQCEEKLRQLESMKQQRKEEIERTVAYINSIYEDLDFEAETKLDQKIMNGGAELNIDDDAVAELSKRAKELQDLKTARTKELKSLGQQIQPLWEKLQIEADARQAFFEQNTGFSEAVLERCRAELTRLQELKQEMLGDLVNDTRKTINELWDHLMIAPSERSSFQADMNSEVYTDALLSRHEAQVEALEARKQVLEPIIRNIEKYYHLCEEREEYEKLILDSSRLLSRKRGQQLREEEQMRKRVEISLPKLVDKLKVTVEEYEANHGDLLYNDDRRFVELMELNEREHAERKIREREAKLKAKKDRKEEELYNQINGRPNTPSKAVSRASTASRPLSKSSTLGGRKRMPARSHDAENSDQGNIR